MPGPPRKPTRLKKLQGNPSRRPLPQKEPQYQVGLPERPRWLKGLAGKCWSSLTPLLLQAKVATIGDAVALEMVCDAYMEYRAARAKVLKLGMTYEQKILVREDEDSHTEVLQIRERPEVKIASDAWKRLRSGLAEFGLTPASRSKVESLMEQQEDELDKFLGNVNYG